MIGLDVSNIQARMLGQLNDSLSCCGREKELTKQKIKELLMNIPMGSLDEQLIIKLRPLNKYTGFDTYFLLDEYTRLEGSKKDTEIQGVKEKIIQLNNDIILRDSVLCWVKSIYISEHQDLIDFFKVVLPTPPFFLFEEEQKPRDLVDRAKNKERIIVNFKSCKNGELKLESKIIFIQRFIRGRLRFDSEIKRIGERYFAKDPQIVFKALEMIQEANTPYAPQKCKPELSQRIMKAAERITLYSSVTHLLAAPNIVKILDDILYGRNNLLNLYISFRPAALHHEDVKNGDGNVICMGPDLIDIKCFKDRTIGLELDLNKLKNDEGFNKNPAMFFKQRDLGFSVKRNSFCLKERNYLFNHTENESSKLNSIACNTNCSPFSLKDGHKDYYAMVPKDLLISSNIKEMDKILILNFFRFIDNLQTDNASKAEATIDEIYTLIDSLSDAELSNFLEEVGKKMSCSSEVNFFGAYKIDLNTILSIKIYKERTLVYQIKMSDLINQLNSG